MSADAGPCATTVVDEPGPTIAAPTSGLESRGGVAESRRRELAEALAHARRKEGLTQELALRIARGVQRSQSDADAQAEMDTFTRDLEDKLHTNLRSPILQKIASALVNIGRNTAGLLPTERYMDYLPVRRVWRPSGGS